MRTQLLAAIAVATIAVTGTADASLMSLSGTSDDLRFGSLSPADHAEVEMIFDTSAPGTAITAFKTAFQVESLRVTVFDAADNIVANVIDNNATITFSPTSAEAKSPDPLIGNFLIFGFGTLTAWPTLGDVDWNEAGAFTPGFIRFCYCPNAGDNSAWNVNQPLTLSEIETAALPAPTGPMFFAIGIGALALRRRAFHAQNPPPEPDHLNKEEEG